MKKIFDPNVVFKPPSEIQALPCFTDKQIMARSKAMLLSLRQTFGFSWISYSATFQTKETLKKRKPEKENKVMFLSNFVATFPGFLGKIFKNSIFNSKTRFHFSLADLQVSPQAVF